MKITKERAQKIWDRELIRSWDKKGKNKMGSVVDALLFEAFGSEWIACSGIPEKIEALVSMELKRCYDVIPSSKELTFQSWGTDVIGFVQARSFKMSSDLIGGVEKIEVLININNYKWSRIILSPRNRDRLKIKRGIKQDVGSRIKCRELGGPKKWAK